MSGVGSEFRQWALLLPFSGNWKVPGLKRLTGLFSIVTAFANSGEILVVVIPLSLLRNQWCISATTIKHSHATYTNAGNHTIDMNLMSLQRCARSIDARHPFLPLFLLLLFALLALSPRTQKKCCFVCVSSQTHINWWPEILCDLHGESATDTTRYYQRVQSPGLKGKTTVVCNPNFVVFA